MECKKSSNLKHCSCTYEPCPRKGICCECVQYHLKRKQLPACFFSPEAEGSYDRSFEKFVESNK